MWLILGLFMIPSNMPCGMFKGPCHAIGGSIDRDFNFRSYFSMYVWILYGAQLLVFKWRSCLVVLK
jgi:hypothetical protein